MTPELACTGHPFNERVVHSNSKGYALPRSLGSCKYHRRFVKCILTKQNPDQVQNCAKSVPRSVSACCGWGPDITGMAHRYCIIPTFRCYSDCTTSPSPDSRPQVVISQPCNLEHCLRLYTQRSRLQGWTMTSCSHTVYMLSTGCRLHCSSMEIY